jgi:DNA-binding NarL/FixJ family response regulator
MVDRLQIASLRAEGLSWAKIAEKLNLGENTVYRMASASAKTLAISSAVSRCEHAAD